MNQKFSLQRVLDLKEQLEDLLQVQVAAIEGQRLDVQHQLESLHHKWSQNSTPQDSAAQEALDPGEMEEIAEYLAALERQIQASGQFLEQVDQELHTKRSELESNYQEKELLHRLKDKWAAGEAREQQRRDTRAQDDVSTSQYFRRNGSGHAHENGNRATGQSGNGHSHTNRNARSYQTSHRGGLED